MCVELEPLGERARGFVRQRWLAMSPTARAAWIAGTIALLVFIPSLWAGFVFDDLMLIAENPFAHELRYVGRTFTTHLWDIYLGGGSGDPRRYYRPMIGASYVLNWVLGGGRAWTFHLVNILVHAGSTVLAV